MRSQRISKSVFALTSTLFLLYTLLVTFLTAGKNNEKLRLQQATLESDLALKSSELLAANAMVSQLREELKSKKQKGKQNDGEVKKKKKKK